MRNMTSAPPRLTVIERIDQLADRAADRAWARAYERDGHVADANFEARRVFENVRKSLREAHGLMA